MDSKKLIFNATVIATFFGNVYAGTYTLNTVQKTIWNFKLLINKSNMIVIYFIMFVLCPIIHIDDIIM